MQLSRFQFTIGQLIKLVAATAFCLVFCVGFLRLIEWQDLDGDRLTVMIFMMVFGAVLGVFVVYWAGQAVRSTWGVLRGRPRPDESLGPIVWRGFDARSPEHHQAGGHRV